MQIIKFLEITRTMELGSYLLGSCDFACLIIFYDHIGLLLTYLLTYQLPLQTCKNLDLFSARFSLYIIHPGCIVRFLNTINPRPERSRGHFPPEPYPSTCLAGVPYHELTQPLAHLCRLSGHHDFVATLRYSSGLRGSS
jgi:hypothetical protein